MTSIQSDVPANADLLLVITDGNITPSEQEVLGKAADTALADAKEQKEAAVWYRDDGGRVALFTVEKDEDLLEPWRLAGAEAGRLSVRLKAEKVALVAPDSLERVGAAVEGFWLGGYRFLKYLTGKDTFPGPSELMVVGEKGEIEEAVRQAEVRSDATNLARDLVNTSPDKKVPALLAGRMEEVLEGTDVSIDIWEKDRIEKEGMGGLLAVNRGSLDEPRFVVMEYAPEGTKEDAPVVLVGKAVTYDTGGLSLKPTKNNMDKMKNDMAGAAAVFCAVVAAQRLALPVRLMVLIPMTDNRPGGRAYVPGDVITMHSGASVEVTNTDAEGRMILADALSYARSLNPRLVVDVATLTGAQIVALGSRVAAVVKRLSDSPDMMEKLRASAEASGDKVWPLPLYKLYKESLKTEVADLQNTGGREGGTIVAASFLEHFTRTEDDEPAYDWLHVDIAAPAFLDKPAGVHPKGGTGFSVRLLIDFLQRLSDS